ncbi:MAG: hypothetical protein WC314_20865 [Vulcanimicrobiota bacterium]
MNRFLTLLLYAALLLSSACADDVVFSQTLIPEYPRTSAPRTYIQFSDERHRSITLRGKVEQLAKFGEALHTAVVKLNDMTPGEEGEVFEIEFENGMIDVVAHWPKDREKLVDVYVVSGDDILAVQAHPEKAGFQKLIKEMSYFITEDTVLSRPDRVIVNGRSIPFSWSKDRVLIDAVEAQRTMSYNGDGLQVDLLEAAKAKGFRLISNGTTVEIRRTYTGDANAPMRDAGSSYSTYSGGSYSSSGGSSSAGGPVHVRGYYRKDGTYVRSHTRSRPSR